MKNEIKLGQKVRDVVTGFTGIAVAQIEYFNGCVQICIKPKIAKDKPTEMPEGMYVDFEQVEVVNEGLLKERKITKTGGTKECPTMNKMSRI